MHTYYLHQEIDFINDKYLVSDVNKQPVLRVVGNTITGIYDRMVGSVFSIGHTLHINNLVGKEEFILKKRVGFIWSHYDVITNNNIIASIIQEKDWFKSRFSVRGTYGNYTISSGDMFGKGFTIFKDGYGVAKINKKILSFTDNYEILLFEPDIFKLIIAIVLAIDNSVHN